MFNIIHDIQKNIPYSRILKDKYLEGTIRLVYLEELDESQQETVNDILSIIESNEVYQKQLDGNFNGLYYEDLSFQFYDEMVSKMFQWKEVITVHLMNMGYL